jgi:probable HAF family extracellular repeat protein
MRQRSSVRSESAAHLAVRSTPARAAVAAAALAVVVAVGGSFEASQQERETTYLVKNLPSLGGTNSRGSSINSLGWIGGYSNLPEDTRRHATLWLFGFQFDLGTLGGPNSSAAWSSAINNRGLIAGISQTTTPDPLGQRFSCWVFFPGPDNFGPTCRGVVWEWGKIRALPLLEGGNNSFATAVNNRGEVTGWSENGVVDPECDPESTQVLQFRPVIWGPARDQIREMPLLGDDTSGTVNAINDRGQAVGISGICDQAVGRHSAKHAVLWENGTVRDLGNAGAPWWNTPTAINQRGDVAGFLGQPGDPDESPLQAFLWTKEGGMQPLGVLPGQTPEHVHSEAYGINERRQVAGLSCDAEFNCRAFLWEDGVMKDLTMLAPGYDGVLLHARDINDRGMISGIAFDPNSEASVAYWAIPRRGRRSHDATSSAAGHGAGSRVAIPDSVKKEIFHPMSSAHAKLAR